MSKATLLLALCLLSAGCRQDMFEEPKYKPLVASNFFTDGRSARPVPPGTLAYGQPERSEAVEFGTTNGNFIPSIPVQVNEQLLKRGQQRFNIYCSPCHGRLGDGNGMIAKRGFLQPANLHSDRVRNAPPGYLFAVIANGYGSMPDYRDQVGVNDRWAIVAYIRALELSRNATVGDVPADEQAKLGSAR
jgi:mono/diheme cytochrome c family protein